MAFESVVDPDTHFNDVSWQHKGIFDRLSIMIASLALIAVTLKAFYDIWSIGWQLFFCVFDDHEGLAFLSLTVIELDRLNRVVVH